MSKLVLVAIGGNALIRADQAGTADEQFANAMETAAGVVQLIRHGHRVVLTHGNGPQIGAMLIRSEASADRAYRMPYDTCVAATQGEVGYVLQYAMWQQLQKASLRVPVVSMVTQVVVDQHDPAFAHPTKPIGPWLTPDEARRCCRDLGWHAVEMTPGRFRRVVPSPEPREVVELEAIRACVDRGHIVIAGGGGGVPVFNDKDITKGVEAVVDKDLTSAILASRLGADTFAIVTGEEHVCLDYGLPTQQALHRVTDVDCRRWLAEGQFPEGSMGPKIQAALAYLDRQGREVVITDIEHLLSAVAGQAGTHIRPVQQSLDWD
ncbi:MAG TPA: carbamate kinase [Gemmatimonadales bacterium]